MLLYNALVQSKVQLIHNANYINAYKPNIATNNYISWYLRLPLLNILPPIKDQDSRRRIVCLDSPPRKYSFLFHFLPSDAHTTPPPPCWDVTKRANCPHRQTPSNALRWNCAALFAVIHSHTNIYCTFFTFATTLNLFQMPFTGTGVASVPWFDSTK